MADSTPAPWQLVSFLERLDAWVEAEQPVFDEPLIATAWTMSRLDDPYQGVSRAEGFDNLWFGVIPGTNDGVSAVVGVYWIEEATRLVRCDSFARLNLPI